MKLNVIKKFAIVTLLGAVACGFAGCSKDDNGDDDSNATKLALVDPTQSALTFDATKSQQVIKLETDAEAVTVEQLSTEPTADWCIIKVKSATEITVEVAMSTNLAERSASYKIKAGTLKPIEFTVTQAAYVAPITKLAIDLAAEYEMYSYMAEAKSPKNLNITVTTDAPGWTAVLEFMMDGDEYCSLSGKASGASGEQITISFAGDNVSPMPKSGAKVIISSGNAEPIEVYINQNVPNATAVDIMNEDWSEQYNTNHPVPFLGVDAGLGKKIVFGVDADGNLLPKVCASGTTTEITTGAWLYAGFGMGVVTMYPTSENTGAARAVDVVLFGGESGQTELFRFKVTQAAKVN